MKEIFKDLIISVLIAFAISAIFSNALSADEKQPQMRMFAAGEVVSLAELGAIIVDRDGNLAVEIINAAEHRPEAYKTVDLRKDDLIVMLNGKKLTTLAELQKGYEGFPIGNELKFGVKRGKDMMIVAFKKGDPKSFRMDFNDVTMGDSTGAKPQMRIVTHRPGGGEGEVLPAVGLILSAAKGGVQVSGTLPHVGDVFTANTPKDGDHIVSIQNKPVKTMTDFLDVFDNLTVGDKVTMVLSRDGKELTTTFVKPKPMGGPMIIQKKSQ